MIMEAIIQRQAEWAAHRGIEVDENLRTPRLDDNLITPLDADTEAEFQAGAGNELGKPDRPGGMASLRGSAALAYNVFGPWRNRDTGCLLRALGSNDTLDQVRFEQRFPTGLQGTPPHLDVVLTGPLGRPVAIESKFTEIYSDPHNEFRPVYLQRPQLWDSLPSLHAVAGRIASGDLKLSHLGAAQLIKHALGLQRAFGTHGYTLFYLWYRWPSAEADLHAEEVEWFGNRVAGDVEFRSMTYQDLFAQLERCPPPISGYREYLAERYFKQD